MGGWVGGGVGGRGEKRKKKHRVNGYERLEKRCRSAQFWTELHYQVHNTTLLGKCIRLDSKNKNRTSYFVRILPRVYRYRVKEEAQATVRGFRVLCM